MELRSRALLIVNSETPTLFADQLVDAESTSDLNAQQMNDVMTEFITQVELSQNIVETLTTLEGLGHFSYRGYSISIDFKEVSKTLLAHIMLLL